MMETTLPQEKDGPWFGHSGDLGDIVYSLPTIRQAGGGTLYLYNQPGKTTHEMTFERVCALRPLLLKQSYIKDVIWCPDGHEDQSLNGFRDHWQHGRNLADMHLATHGYDWLVRTKAWLRVDEPKRIAPVIFCRTDRYQNLAFPWERIRQKFQGHAIFLGTKDEHRHFCDKFGGVPYYPTKNLLIAAQIIAGSKLCVANQSVLHAIAEGLKCNIIMEVFPDQNNCSFERFGRINAWDDRIELPEISCLDQDFQ